MRSYCRRRRRLCVLESVVAATSWLMTLWEGSSRVIVVVHLAALTLMWLPPPASPLAGIITSISIPLSLATAGHQYVLESQLFILLRVDGFVERSRDWPRRSVCIAAIRSAIVIAAVATATLAEETHITVYLLPTLAPSFMGTWVRRLGRAVMKMDAT